MNCSCGIPAFFYETIKSDDIKYSVYKCGALFSESKRGKCSLNLETALNKIKVPLQPTVCEIISKDAVQNDISETDNKDELYKNLKNYIHLIEISKNNHGMSRDNYVSNINFILKKLNLPFFFPKNEKLISLKYRINDIPRKQQIKKSLYPITILEMPENLKIKNKIRTRKVKKVLNKCIDKTSMSYIILDSKNIIDGIKKLEIKSDSEHDSDSENENENEEDCSFDVDISESEIEDNYSDGGDFSD